MRRRLRSLRHGAIALAAAMALGGAAPARADPVTIVVVAAQALGAAGVIAAATATYIALAATVVGGVMARRKAKRAAAESRAAVAAALQDRSVTLMTAEPEPKIVYGRCTIGGWVIDKMTSSKTWMDDRGITRTKPDAYQHVVIGLTCHEVHAIHDVFMYGEWLGVNGADGWVNGGPADAPYGKPHNVVGVSAVTFTNGTATLPAAENGYAISRIISISRRLGGRDGDGVYGGSVAFSGSTVTGGPASGLWNVNYEVTKMVSSLRVEFHTGSPDQVASAWLKSVAPGYWTDAHRLRGIAYAVITFDLDDGRHQGIPGDLTFDVSGRRVADPRTGLTAWSRNAALCAGDWMMQRWGLSLTQDDMRDLKVLADICDQQVSLTVGTTTTLGPRYTIDGAFGVNADRAATLADLTEAMGGFASQGAQWGLHAGAWTAPVLDIVEDDLAAPVRVVRSSSALDDRFNAARGTYVPERTTQPTDCDPYINTAFVAADGQREWSDFTFPFTNHKARARNLLRQFVEQVRAGLMIQVVGKMRLWPLEVGDRVTVTYARLGLAADTFRVIDWTWSPGSWVMLTLQRDIAASYDDADASTPDPAPATRLPNPGLVDVPSELQAISGSAQLQRLGDGTIIPRVLVSWKAAASIYMSDPGARIAIRWRNHSDPVWTEIVVSGNSTSAYLEGVADKALIIISVQFRNSFGAVSPWISTPHKVIGKSGAPTAPTALAVTETMSGQRLFQVTHVQDLDHAGYVIRYSTNTAATYDQMTQVAAMWSGDALTGQSALPADGTYRFGCVAYDGSGNTSGAVYVVATLKAVSEMAAGGDNLVQTGFPKQAGQQTFWSAPVVAVSPAGSTAWPCAIEVTQRDTVENQAGFPISAGDSIYVEADATTWRTPVQLQVGLLVRKSDGSVGWLDGSYGAPTKAGGTGWTHLSGKIIVPQGGWIMAWPWIQLDTPNGTPQPGAWVSNIMMTRAQLGATKGADWATNVVGRPANIAGLTGGERIRNDQLPSGANVLFDSDFTVGVDTKAWALGNNVAANIDQIGINLSQQWTMAGGVGPSTNTLYVHQQGRTAGNADFVEVLSQPFAVDPAKFYCASAHTGAHRCKVAAFMYFFDSANAVVGHSYNNGQTVENDEATNGDSNLGASAWKRCFSIAQPPSTAKHARLFLRKYNTKPGQVDSWMFAARAQVEEVGAAADGPAPWTIGPGAAKFGANIYGRAATDDIADSAATDVVAISINNVQIPLSQIDLARFVLPAASRIRRVLVSLDCSAYRVNTTEVCRALYALNIANDQGTVVATSQYRATDVFTSSPAIMSARMSFEVPAGMQIAVFSQGIPSQGQVAVSGTMIVEVIKL